MELIRLIRWEFIHLWRNQLIAVSFLLALTYLGVFQLLKNLGNLDALLVLIIFNDPIITGFLFAGGLWLFEKNQHLDQALGVIPFNPANYIWARAISLSLLAVVVSLFMVGAVHGFSFQWSHLILGIALMTSLFVFVGLIIGFHSVSFTNFIGRSIFVFLISAIPFLSLFGVWDSPLFYLVPTYPGIILLKAAFSESTYGTLIYAYAASIIYVLVFYYWAHRQMLKSLGV